MRSRMAVIGGSIALATLVACSGAGQDVVRSGAPSGGSALEVVQRASQKTTDAGTAKVAMTFDIAGLAGLDPTTFTVDGAIDSGAGQSSFTFDVATLAAALPESQRAGVASILGNGNVEIVTDGSDVYLRLGGLAAILGATADKPWIKVSAGEGAASALGAPLGDGTEVLKLLDQAGGLTSVGSETVRGVDTTHYQGSLDVASALAEVSADDRAKAESELGKVGIDPAAAEVPVDVWIDGDDLVRRVQVGVSTPATAGGTFTMELYDFGQPVNVTVPPASQVFDVDPAMLGSLSALAGG